MHAGPPPAANAWMQPAFDAAAQACLTGHPAGCTYGGLTPADGFWIVVTHCPRRHAAWCTWCGRRATTSFTGWQDLRIWGVPACRACAELYRAAHPDLEQPDSGGRVEDPALAHSIAEFENDIRDDLARAADRLEAKYIGEPRPSSPTVPQGPRAMTGLLHAVDELAAWENAAARASSLYGGLPPHPSCLDPHLGAQSGGGASWTFWAGRAIWSGRLAFDARMRQLITCQGISKEEARRIADGLLAFAEGPAPTPGQRPQGEPW